VFRDPETGEATLKVTALHGDQVYMEIGGPATPGSKKLDSNDYKTKEMELCFLAVDSTKVHETGEQFVWKNTVTLKHRFFQDGEVMRCEVRAAPGGQIKFTTDGSNPTQNGGTYTEAFVVPTGSKFVQAVGINGSIQSEVLRVSVPAEPEKLVIDPTKPYDWDRKFDKDSTMEAYEFLSLCRKFDVGMKGVQANADIPASHRFAEFLFDAKFPYMADQVQSVLDLLQSLLPDSKLTLRVSGLNFANGQSLLDMVADLKMQLPPVGEVKEVIPK
jgi:hypothetical protein